MSRVTFTSKDVQPPAALYLPENAFLWIEVVASSAVSRVELEGHLLRADGEVVPFVFSFAPTGDRLPSSAQFHVGEGFLLSMRARLRPTTFQRGVIYATAGIERGTTPGQTTVQTLLAGYIHSTFQPSWPPGYAEPAVGGKGNIRSITGTDPAANTEVSETVPTHALWRPLALRVRLVTDGTAATRLVHVLLDDGTTTLVLVPAAATQVASLTRDYSAAPFGVTVTTSATEILIPLPSGILLRAGHRIRTSTENLQATDNYGAPQLLVEEWIEVVG